MSNTKRVADQFQNMGDVLTKQEIIARTGLTLEQVSDSVSNLVSRKVVEWVALNTYKRIGDWSNRRGTESMTIRNSLRAAIMGSKVIQFDQRRSYFLCWFGGTYIRVFDHKGVEVSCWSYDEEWTLELVVASMERHISEGYYPC